MTENLRERHGVELVAFADGQRQEDLCTDYQVPLFDDRVRLYRAKAFRPLVRHQIKPCPGRVGFTRLGSEPAELLHWHKLFDFAPVIRPAVERIYLLQESHAGLFEQDALRRELPSATWPRAC